MWHSSFWFFFVNWVPVGLCTVHGTHKPLCSIKISLKMGSTVLFIHLKIILLQCFMFSVVFKRTLKRRKDACSHSIIEFIFIFLRNHLDNSWMVFAFYIREFCEVPTKITWHGLVDSILNFAAKSFIFILQMMKTNKFEHN